MTIYELEKKMWIALVNLFRVTFIVVLVVVHYDCCCFDVDGGCKLFIMALTSFFLHGRVRCQPTVLVCFSLLLLVFRIVCVVDVLLVVVVIVLMCFAPSSTSVLLLRPQLIHTMRAQ